MQKLLTGENSGQAIGDHFANVSKMVPLGSGSKREIEDIALTLYACYAVRLLIGLLTGSAATY